MHTLDMDQLLTFVAIAETGSFTEAAQKVSRTQSAVSMQMKRLEETVGRPIFARDGRRSRLTDHGVTLLDYARRILTLNAETMAIFQASDIRGKARLGLPDDYAPRLLPMVLATFDRAHPNLEIDVTCDISRKVVEKVSKGELDIGIVTFYEGVRNHVADPRVVRRETAVPRRIAASFGASC
ncbi:MAG: LysR family transcriptional regulator [Hyphomicrobiales bacterium]